MPILLPAIKLNAWNEQAATAEIIANAFFFINLSICLNSNISS